jgi:hypothetical protein
MARGRAYEASVKTGATGTTKINSTSQKEAVVTIEVIGAGFGRTGTLSLKFALEALGYDKCYHMMEVILNDSHVAQWRKAARGEAVDWAELYQGYRATVDWPSASFWRELRVAYPNAKVILTLRDSQQWYTSVMNTIWKLSSTALEEGQRRGDEEMIERAMMGDEVIWGGVFGNRMDDRNHVIECFERHNQAVIDSVPEEQLLIYRPGDGWDPLCEFLQQPVPDTDYPKVNSTEDFLGIWRKSAKS